MAEQPHEEKRFPEVIASAFIVKGGKILLVKSPRWWGRYSIPGAHVKLGEAVEDTVRRAVKENVGLDVEPIKLLRVADAIFPQEYYQLKHFVFLDFLCRPKDPEQPVRADGKDAQEPMWIRPEEAKKIGNITSFTANLIEGYIKTQRPAVRRAKKRRK